MVWDEIAHAGYKIRWYKDIIYLCDYQADGLTLNIENYVRNSFEGYSLAKNKSFHYLPLDRKSTRLNSSHISESRMPSFA